MAYTPLVDGDLATPAKFNAIFDELDAGTASTSGIVINVKDYGAVGDGVTDDTTAINAASDASSEGDIIYFAAGSYLISAPIRIPPHRTYQGTNWSHRDAEGAVTYIKQAANANMVAMMASVGYLDDDTTARGGVVIQNVFLDGNRGNNINTHGILLMNWRSRVEHCHVRWCPGSGIVFTDQNSAGGDITNTAVSNRIQFNVVTHCDGSAYEVLEPGANNALTDGYMLDNYGGNCGERGIDVQRASGWHVIGNRIFQMGFDGIVANFSQNCLIANNIVQDWGNSATTGSYKGIWISTMLNDEVNAIVGNVLSNVNAVSGSTYTLIRAQAGAGVALSHVNIVGNTGSGNGAGNGIRIEDGGTGDVDGVVTGNYIINTASASVFGRSSGMAGPKQYGNNWNESLEQLAVNDTTPRVDEGSRFKTNSAISTTITTFDEGYDGQVITLLVIDNNTTLSDNGGSAGLWLSGAANWTPTVGDTISLMYRSSNSIWYELSRSDNTP
jgi:hypothetical protein